MGIYPRPYPVPDKEVLIKGSPIIIVLAEEGLEQELLEIKLLPLKVAGLNQSSSDPQFDLSTPTDPP
jgi:hypothetical protein